MRIVVLGGGFDGVATLFEAGTGRLELRYGAQIRIGVNGLRCIRWIPVAIPDLSAVD